VFGIENVFSENYPKVRTFNKISWFGKSDQMISTLNKLGIEPQAVEQPLDLSIPENKMMLARYLSAPEWKRTAGH